MHPLLEKLREVHYVMRFVDGLGGKRRVRLNARSRDRGHLEYEEHTHAHPCRHEHREECRFAETLAWVSPVPAMSDLTPSNHDVADPHHNFHSVWMQKSFDARQAGM